MMLAWLAGLGWIMKDSYPNQRLHFWYSLRAVEMESSDGLATCICPSFFETAGATWPRS